MEMWLLIAIAVWAGLCVPAVQEIWQMLRMGRVTAVVLGHPKKADRARDDALLVAFESRNGKAVVHTYLPTRYPRLVLQARWPVNCPVEVTYDPSSPTVVAWPRRTSRIVALCCLIFSIPVLSFLLTLS